MRKVVFSIDGRAVVTTLGESTLWEPTPLPHPEVLAARAASFEGRTGTSGTLPLSPSVTRGRRQERRQPIPILRKTLDAIAG
jgi:hypothetical protein